MTESRLVYSSDPIPKRRPREVLGETWDKRAGGMDSVGEPLPSQKYTYQRGLALAALRLPAAQREAALLEALEALGLQHRVMPRRERK